MYVTLDHKLDISILKQSFIV